MFKRDMKKNLSRFFVYLNVYVNIKTRFYLPSTFLCFYYEGLFHFQRKPGLHNIQKSFGQKVFFSVTSNEWKLNWDRSINSQTLSCMVMRFSLFSSIIFILLLCSLYMALKSTSTFSIHNKRNMFLV